MVWVLLALVFLPATASTTAASLVALRTLATLATATKPTLAAETATAAKAAAATETATEGLIHTAAATKAALVTTKAALVTKAAAAAKLRQNRHASECLRHLYRERLPGLVGDHHRGLLRILGNHQDFDIAGLDGGDGLGGGAHAAERFRAAQAPACAAPTGHAGAPRGAPEQCSRLPMMVGRDQPCRQLRTRWA